MCHRALKKWHERKELTRKCRDRQEKFTEFKRLMWQRAVFNGIRETNAVTKNFADRLRQAAEKLDHRQNQSAFQMIKNFAHSKDYNHARQKRHAASDMASALHELYLTRMAQNMSAFRKVVYDQKRKDRIIGSMLGHWTSRSLRSYFMRWKNQADLATVVIDVNETGPVVEEVLDERLRWENLRKLMAHQGYVPH